MGGGGYARLAGALERVSGATVVVDGRGRLRAASPRARALLGLAPGALPRLAEVLRLGVPLARLIHHPGSPAQAGTRTVRCWAQRVPDLGAALLVGLDRPPTLPGARHAGQARLARALDAIPLALAWCARSGAIVHANPALTALFGTGPVRRAGTLWNPALGLDGAALQSLWPAPDTSTAQRGLVGLRRPDGTGATLGVVIATLRDRSDTVLVQLSDVTERVERQERASQTDKLEAVGRLGAGIAHEINTPLQFVGDNLGFLGEAAGALVQALTAGQALHDACAGNPETAAACAAYTAALDALDVAFYATEAPPAVRQSIEGLQRVTQIVGALRDYTHPGGDSHEAVDLNRLLEAVVTITRNTWKYVADLRLDPDPGVPAVLGNAGELHQVFVNLIVNAAQAIGELKRQTTGQIQVSTRAVRGGVAVRVADDGPGIPEALRERIFEPFFTTKAVGQGTGQGLALVHRIVTVAHAGTLDLASAPGQGAAFTVWLPALAVGA